MEKGKLSKILAIVLTLVMVVGLMSPISMLTAVAVESEEEPFNYAPTAFSKEMLVADGWVATKNDGTTITTYDESIYNAGKRKEFWWKIDTDGSIIGQGDTDCESNFGKAQQSLTYTGKKLDEFDIAFATNTSNYNYRASFSIGVQTPGEYYKDETSPSNVITVTTNPNNSSIVGVNKFEIKGAAIQGGSATCTVVGDSDSMIYWQVKVYNDTLFIAGNGNSYEFKLNDNYIGGYFSITSPNSYTKYYPPTINTFVDSDSEYKLYSYSPNQLKTDGWVATKNDGTTITTYDDNIYKTGTFFWKLGSGAKGANATGQGNDCEGNFGKAYQNLTYTGKEFKNLNLKFKTAASGWHCGIAFSIGVKNAGEIYLDSNSPSNVITAKTNFVSNGDMTQLTVSGAAVEGGSKTFSIAKDSNNLLNWDVTVRGKKLYITCNSNTMELNLNDNYVGGYVQLSSPNSYSEFYPITVKEIEYDENEYFTTLNSLSDLEADGWKASYSSNPSAGEAFVDCNVTDYLLNAKEGGIQRNEKGFDWRTDRGYGNWKDPFYYMSALTYTGEQYKYFTLSVDYEIADPTIPWPIVSFGQQSATAEMFYAPINANANPAGGETPIAVYPELEGSINIKGKNVTAARKEATAFTDKYGWHTMTITVTPGKVEVSIDNGVVTHSTILSDNYTGGYISLMLGHSYSIFKNLKINKIEYDYSSTLSNLNTLAEDGWKASYSSNPSAGEAFVDCNVTDYLLNAKEGGIQRNEKGFDWRTDRGYGNWKDPFYYMSALTYTGQQYKYFTLSVDYMVADPTIPWPIVSFGQQNATAEMFYAPINANANPAGGETPIAVYPELEGSINIKGKNVVATRKDATAFTDKMSWHTMTITVTPGKVDVSIDNGVVTHSTTLSSSYSGGYISLMLGHSYSIFKNFKINAIDDEFAGDVNLDGTINSMDLVMLRKILLSNESDMGNSDVNRDTLVDARDIVRLKKQLVSIENESITQISDLSVLDSVKKKIIL